MNIDSSYINAYNVNNINPTSVEKLSGNDSIEKIDDVSTNSFVSQNLEIQKSSLSQTIQNVNTGLAISAIAQNGIDKQTDILENIKNELLNNDTIDQDDVTRISQYIEEYEDIAGSFTFNGQSLLKAEGDASDDLSIVSDDSIIELAKADTTSISDSLKSFMTDLASNPDAVENMLNVVDQGLEQLASFSKDYSDASELFENAAKDSMKNEFDVNAGKSTIANIDYNKETTDFSKTNLLAQVGYLVQTQANAAQAKNVALLS